MENHDLADDDRQMLFCFFHEIVSCVKLMWKEKSLQGGTFSNVVTASDEAFTFLIMRDYAKITTKEDRKQVKLAGENLTGKTAISLHILGKFHVEPCGTTWTRTISCKVANVISMPMVRVPPLHIIRICYSDGYSNPYVIRMLYSGWAIRPVPSWYLVYGA